jgi:hypothetical protein
LEIINDLLLKINKYSKEIEILGKIPFIRNDPFSKIQENKILEKKDENNPNNYKSITFNEIMDLTQMKS